MLNDLPSVARRSSTNRPVLISHVDLSRRDFLRLSGIGLSGLVLGACFGGPKQTQTSVTVEPQALNLFVSIAGDGSVSILTHRSEMGQGIRTGLPQIVADELEADWQQVKVIQALGDARYGDQNTDGSRSIRDFYTIMRQMGAAARTLLEQAAAASWQVPVHTVRAQNHQVVHLPTGRVLGYGELAEKAARLPVPDPAALRLKTPEDFTRIGQPLPPVDLADFLDGSARFGIDVQLPDLVHASIERCPVIGGTLESLDDREARQMKGVLDVVVIPPNTFPIGFAPLHGVAVIATSTWIAQQARAKLKCVWSPGENGSYDSATELAQLRERVRTPGQPSNTWGDYTKAQEDAAWTHEAVYTVPYLAHAPMEPPAATARITAGGCELWVCTQSPQSVQEHVAKTLGLAKEQVKVNVTLLGGAFGRKAKADFSLEAAILAQQLGRPVKVTWTREDDIKAGYYHAHSAQYLQATLDAENRVTGWLQRTAFPSIMSIFADVNAAPASWELDMGFNEMPLSVPNWQSESHAVAAHVRIGWVRSVCNIQHAFARSSFIDELAALCNRPAPLFLAEMLGNDPVFDASGKNYQYGNYGGSSEDHPLDLERMRRVVREATHLGTWSGMPSGEGWGIAAHRSFLSYVAVVTRVQVLDNRLEVKEVHVVIDCGLAVNPDRVRAQMEGAVIFGLSLALGGEIRVHNGAVMQNNFNDYPLLRINQCPDIQVKIIESQAKPAGVGEPGVPPVAPSLTNAIFAAAGVRIRELPVNKVLQV